MKTLTALERQSALWQTLKPRLEQRLEMLRRKNDRPLSDDDTARLRGRIEEVKYILSLGTDTPSIESEEARFKD